jgi:hypothetical protein
MGIHFLIRSEFDHRFVDRDKVQLSTVCIGMIRGGAIFGNAILCGCCNGIDVGTQEQELPIINRFLVLDNGANFSAVNSRLAFSIPSVVMSNNNFSACLVSAVCFWAIDDFVDRHAHGLHNAVNPDKYSRSVIERCREFECDSQ